jgi:ABC-type Fe3+-hydroxamate transport system substrate-binding protein
MTLFIDQLNRTLTLSAKPKRIISLVPSQTELLHHLGLNDEVIGITKFCVHPSDWFETKNRVGGTKHYDFDKIKALQPDLIIGNKEENDKAQIAQLMQLYPVWMSDINNLNDALDMILRLSELVGKQTNGKELVQELETTFARLQSERELPPLKVAYFIWRKPYMVAGANTFINDMLQRCGFSNVFANEKERYPQVDLSFLASKKPDVILLSSEPYPFAEKHFLELEAVCPKAKIILVDGELFSWYGSRLLNSVAYFNNVKLQLY